MPADVVLEKPPLPPTEEWVRALNLAGATFGITLAGRALHGENLKRFQAQLNSQLKEAAAPAANTTATARAVSPGGVAVVGSFALGGPTRCSGLPIVQYSPETLAAQFLPAFELERSEHEIHTTPSGVTQPFTWVVMRRRPQA